MAGLVGAAVLQFLAVPIFTRSLGPAEYSLLALSLAVSTSISGLLLIGGDLALSRFWFSTGDGHERRSLTLTWILFLTAWSIPVVALACAVAPLVSDWVSPDTSITHQLQIAFAILVPAQLSRMLAQVMRNEFRPWPFAVTSTAIAGLSLVIGLWLAVRQDLGVAGVLLGTLAGESLGVLIRAPLVMPALRGSLYEAGDPGPARLRAPVHPGLSGLLGLHRDGPNRCRQVHDAGGAWGLCGRRHACGPLHDPPNRIGSGVDSEDHAGVRG